MGCENKPAVAGKEEMPTVGPHVRAGQDLFDMLAGESFLSCSRPPCQRNPVPNRGVAEGCEAADVINRRKGRDGGRKVPCLSYLEELSVQNLFSFL